MTGAAPAIAGTPKLNSHVPRTEAEALQDRITRALAYAKAAVDLGPRMAMVERTAYYDRTFQIVVRILEGKHG